VDLDPGSGDVGIEQPVIRIPLSSPESRVAEDVQPGGVPGQVAHVTAPILKTGRAKLHAS
jgi:hypothetical protein